MPIKAYADKLTREIELFGNPPVFPLIREEVRIENQKKIRKSGGGKYKGKKSKAAAKADDTKYQWEIMQMHGLSDEEIPELTDPRNWLTYFPPLAVEDLKAFGLGCDWRRTFITTDMNPYFDSFVRWQMRKLKSTGKIVKDLSYAIYSPLDGQICADHDRATGEGERPEEYTLVKMQVIPPLPSTMSASLDGKNVYLAAATLRPETLYGQTNCWVLPDEEYGAFEINETDVFILTKRAARNLAYQMLSRIPENPTCLVELTGCDLIGLPLKSPLAFYERIYALPMLSLFADEATGIYTSVPSDCPEDYLALLDLKSKPNSRSKYNLKDEWVMPFEILPIIRRPDFGDYSAEKICIKENIKSLNEREELEEANKKLFYGGTMLVGDFVNMKVEEARDLIRRKLLEHGQAVVYSEPSETVISRSGDECVVALTDQWYIAYGEQEWKKAAEECLAGMNLYSDENRNRFETALTWLTQWGCSRNFGLGTRIPWEEQFLVESLSDSTLYMAYYTVAHILQKGDMYGGVNEDSLVKPDELTDEVWDFLFAGGKYPKSSKISSSILDEMKKEFEYWYPFDLRVSGNDLIQNHLTFCVYNHVAIMAKHHWPKGFRCNGHLMLNSQKMSKSKGNFITLGDAIRKFSADATRFSLADAGDGSDDANFVDKTANAAILRLTGEISWMEKVLGADVASTSSQSGPHQLSTFADRVFSNEIDIAVKLTEKNYGDNLFREALKSGFYDLQAAGDEYLKSGTNRDLLCRFMDVQTRLIAPICPHYAEYVWREILHKEGYVVKAGWPEANSPDFTLRRANKYLQDSIVSMRKLLHKQISGYSKKGILPNNYKNKPKIGLIFVDEEYEGWKAECLKILKRNFDAENSTFAPDGEIIAELARCEIGGPRFLEDKKSLCMQFLRYKKDEVRALDDQALELRLPFGEIDVLVENKELIKRELGLESVEVLSVRDGGAVDRAGEYASVLNANPPSPGKPTAIFLS